MKIRTGFVSNSSTSSFCIYGASIEYTALKHLDDVDESARKLGLQCYDNEYDAYSIGMCATAFRDDETGAQFKERIKALLQQLVGEQELPFQVDFISGEYAC